MSLICDFWDIEDYACGSRDQLFGVWANLRMFQANLVPTCTTPPPSKRCPAKVTSSTRMTGLLPTRTLLCCYPPRLRRPHRPPPPHSATSPRSGRRTRALPEMGPPPPPWKRQISLLRPAHLLSRDSPVGNFSPQMFTAIPRCCKIKYMYSK